MTRPTDDVDALIAAYLAAPDDRTAIRILVEGAVRLAGDAHRARRLPRRWRWGLALLLVALALFVWPTPFAWYRGPQATMIRVNRLTGDAELIVPTRR